jgi:AcrR family transcriptional regulator
MGVNERKEKEKEIRRKDIIDAAEELFFTKGYVATTMDDISKMAEFSKRTVYVYFNRKEQIYFEIMVRGYKKLICLIENEIEDAKEMNALDKLVRICRTFFKFSNEHTEYFNAIMEYENGELDFVKEISDKSREECYELGEKVFSVLVSTIEGGIEEGVIKRELDVVSTAIVLWSCTLGVFNTISKKKNYLLHYHKRNPEELLPESINFFIRSIQNVMNDTTRSSECL